VDSNFPEHRSADHFPEHVSFPDGTGMSPRPDKYLDTDDDMQDHHSSLLLQDLGDNRSYVDVEQPPKFKNSHTEKAPEGR
jgi:hypothetical protein